ncbi:MAG: glutamine-hydrolyzing carbamoyl-phosphate synthase small subunit [Limnochordia bacterium]|nr:glutamine-hydrolyzing carbamoyl-phosphate synthase small subunit [Bacillota bacterium]HOB09049.1 glutamine-hydrolyzing carbamoyl-phosphate synthase small subunit [Limnochordia bacterium]NLH30776.1 glutamine-hydrolyzing carbamoyl-phosphate synthase small subunit [Bacillota bacterium]HPT92862.1 glutamine-hydrolyzing carbamoyl-phosphate synthase small subunit [Limnochordia bacterium]HPZ31206.1 glutamine-hydrolyzing carbamoyl-phosphate synthase small subunit [Limnochordia bacterium]
MKAWLVLEDGTVYQGDALGATGIKSGEVVFTTGMTGYQETLTDPTFVGQIVVMTYPLIGNCGTNADDMEAGKPFLHGLVVREASRWPSNWRSQEDLNSMLTRCGVIGIEGIDTRSLTRKLRSQGTLKGVICSPPEGSKNVPTTAELTAMARQCPHVDRASLIKQVTTAQPYQIGCGSVRVTVIDYGVKQSILKCLVDKGCLVTVVPATASVQEILATEPHGILLSNGPGDPRDAGFAADTVKKLIGLKPLFGICLGHQLLSLALGADVFKLKFGHRGGNHPVKDLRTGRVLITSQNHGYAVDAQSIDPRAAYVTHVSLNDGTVEGLRHRSLPIASIQYHPEASPGPHDTRFIFDEFMAAIVQSAS